MAFPKDRMGHKSVVYGTFLLESVQTFLFTSSAFKTFATGFGNPSALDKVDILWFSMFMMSGMGESKFKSLSRLSRLTIVMSNISSSCIHCSGILRI